MVVGDLVKMKNTTTGDMPEVVRFWREGTPLLIVQTFNPTVEGAADDWNAGITTVLAGGRRYYLQEHRLMVIHEAG